MTTSVHYHINYEPDTQFIVTHHPSDRGEFFALDAGQLPVPNELTIYMTRAQLETLSRVVNEALETNSAPVEPLDAETEARLLLFAQEDRVRRGLVTH